VTWQRRDISIVTEFHQYDVHALYVSQVSVCASSWSRNACSHAAQCHSYLLINERSDCGAEAGRAKLGDDKVLYMWTGQGKWSGLEQQLGLAWCWGCAQALAETRSLPASCRHRYRPPRAASCIHLCCALFPLFISTLISPSRYQRGPKTDGG
jgi:hypothetical protein